MLIIGGRGEQVVQLHPENVCDFQCVRYQTITAFFQVFNSSYGNTGKFGHFRHTDAEFFAVLFDIQHFNHLNS